jgi:hypothetical protein
MAAFDPQAPVTGYPLALMEQFDHLRAEAGSELLLDQGIGHRIGVPLDVDRVVDVDPQPFPLGVVVGIGGQRSSGGAL